MNKLVWIIVVLIAIIVLGSGGVYAYTKGYRVKLTKPEKTSQSTEPSSTPATTSTTDLLASEKTVKETHCLSNPTKGTQIVINNLTDYQTATSPLLFSGNANAFESQFNYRLKDCSGTILDQGYITAEGEMGTMPPFTKTITFTLSQDPTDAILEAYEISAEDGSENNLYQVPMRLTN